MFEKFDAFALIPATLSLQIRIFLTRRHPPVLTMWLLKEGAGNNLLPKESRTEDGTGLCTVPTSVEIRFLAMARIG